MKRVRLLFLLLPVAAALAAAVFFARDPVLVVTDVPFAALYGERRIRQRRAAASFSLFRRVLPVMIADDASADLVVAALGYAAERPFAVVFPGRFHEAAQRFHSEFPDVAVVLFRGTGSGGVSGGAGFGVFAADRDTDLFRAGLIAGIAGAAFAPPPPEEGEPPQRIHVLVQDASVTDEGRAVFSGAAQSADPGSAVIFVSSAAEMPDMGIASSLVIAGAGGDFLERNPGAPVVLFSWLDPAFTSGDVLVLFDDSHWALAARSVRAVSRGRYYGVIPSRPLIFSDRIADNDIARRLRRASGRGI